MGATGVIMVAVGVKARLEAVSAIGSLHQWHDWPVAVIGESVAGAAQVLPHRYPGYGARRAKLAMCTYSPWDQFLYLDADTRVHGDISAGFDILADGWDMAITASDHQEQEWLWHVGDNERAETEERHGRLVQLQGGMMFVAKNDRTRLLFEAWQYEWSRYQGEDQAALLRALQIAPVKLWLLGRDYNGGALVEHRFGRARG